MTARVGSGSLCLADIPPERPLLWISAQPLTRTRRYEWPPGVLKKALNQPDRSRTSTAHIGRESISKSRLRVRNKASARAWQARGPGFESPMLHQHLNSKLALVGTECQVLRDLTTKADYLLAGKWSASQIQHVRHQF